MFIFNCQSRRWWFYCGRFRWLSQTRLRRRWLRCWQALLQTLVLCKRSFACPSWNVFLWRDLGYGQRRTGRSYWSSLCTQYRCLHLNFLCRFRKEAHVCLDILLFEKIWFQRLDHLSVSIQVYRNFVQSIMFKVERIFFTYILFKASLSMQPIMSLDRSCPVNSILWLPSKLPARMV